MRHFRIMWLAILLAFSLAAACAEGLEAGTEARFVAEQEILAPDVDPSVSEAEYALKAPEEEARRASAGYADLVTDGAQAVMPTVGDFRIDLVGNLIKYEGAGGYVTLPSDVVTVGEYAFSGCKGLVCVDIPATTLQISAYAFDSCPNLNSVAIYGSVSLGVGAFGNCPKLYTVALGQGVDYIPERAFQNCTALTQIIIPDSVTTIHPSAFAGCTALEKVTLLGADADRLARTDAFRGTGGSKPTILTPDVKGGSSGGSSADDFIVSDSGRLTGYYGSRENSEVVIPGDLGITSIGSYTFCDRPLLRRVTIPAGVNAIESKAFSDCGGLTTVTLLGTDAYRVKIAKDAFGGKTPTISRPNATLEPFVVENGTLVIYNGTEQDLVIPDDLGITALGEGVFESNKALKSVQLPAGLTVIGKHAFYYCESLQSVAFPKKLKTIGVGAFADCKSLGDVDLSKYSRLSIETTAFFNCSAMKHIYLPADTSFGDSVFRWYHWDEHFTPIDEQLKVTLHADAGSSVEKYAKENGLNFEQNPIPAKSIKLSKKGTYAATLNKKFKLKATISPSNSTTKTVTWESGNKHVVWVKADGTVTPVGVGTATITATADSAKARIKIKVSAPKPKTVKLEQGKTATLTVGAKLTLKATFDPIYADSRLTWKSSDKRVATVSKKGVVKARKAGKAKITVQTQNGKKATITVIIK